MLRALAAAVLGLMLTACATAPPRIVASAKAAVEFSDELECLADCLDDGEACEACVDRCLNPQPGPVVAAR
jgi:hypothetical protein